ncbi:MAG TPA: hypothetical protein VD838_23130 [Anaeromyxobacteraceae bacterium]|nr:hypothetical protein [Anaeromyxobacteraceae bacterium]
MATKRCNTLAEVEAETARAKLRVDQTILGVEAAILRPDFTWRPAHVRVVYPRDEVHDHETLEGRLTVQLSGELGEMLVVHVLEVREVRPSDTGPLPPEGLAG